MFDAFSFDLFLPAAVLIRSSYYLVVCDPSVAYVLNAYHIVINNDRFYVVQGTIVLQ